MEPHINLAAAPLGKLLAEILKRKGCKDAEAEFVATHLVDANLTGHDSHGVVRISRYAEWIDTGILTANAPLTKVLDLGQLALFDGGSGMGQSLAHQATAQGVELARQGGSGIVLLRRAGHIGRVGAFAEQAANAGVVSLFFTNVAGSRLVAPYGAAERAGSTAPVTVGVPADNGQHFLLDFATSFVAEGKALVAAKAGRDLSDQALIDGMGQPTGDPHALYGETYDDPAPNPNAGPGALRPFGDHKGSGLMLACELLGGALTGNGTNGPAGHPFSNGVLMVFIDPKRVGDGASVADEVASYLGYVKELRPGKGTESVLIPGDKERASRIHRTKNGLPLPKRLAEEIFALAESLGANVDRAELVVS